MNDGDFENMGLGKTADELMISATDVLVVLSQLETVWEA